MSAEKKVKSKPSKAQWSEGIEGLVIHTQMFKTVNE